MKSLFISVPKKYFYATRSSLTERVCFFIIHFSLFYKNKLIIFDNSDVKDLCNFLKDFSVFWTVGEVHLFSASDDELGVYTFKTKTCMSTD